MQLPKHEAMKTEEEPECKAGMARQRSGSLDERGVKLDKIAKNS